MCFQAAPPISLPFCRSRVPPISPRTFLPQPIFSWFLFITSEASNSLASPRRRRVCTALWLVDVTVHFATLRPPRTMWRKAGGKTNITTCEECWRRLRKRNWERPRGHGHGALRLQCPGGSGFMLTEEQVLRASWGRSSRLSCTGDSRVDYILLRMVPRPKRYQKADMHSK